jgi:hypothetical protein
MERNPLVPVPEPLPDPVNWTPPVRCQARKPVGHGLYTYCMRAWGHPGGHIYRDD